jgi:hypothetical protein
LNQPLESAWLESATLDLVTRWRDPTHVEQNHRKANKTTESEILRVEHLYDFAGFSLGLSPGSKAQSLNWQGSRAKLQ